MSLKSEVDENSLGLLLMHCWVLHKFMLIASTHFGMLFLFQVTLIYQATKELFSSLPWYLALSV